MITVFDSLNIGFYFAFIVGVGLYFARKSKDTSDYFRGGGVLPWWITGTSAWMAGFSAWTFTGAAAKIYETGTYALGLYYSNIIPLVVLLLVGCYRFRRLRVITPLEALRLRFGRGAQQLYTWLRLPIMMIFGAFGLNAVGVFMAAVFAQDVTVVIVILGVLVAAVSMLGGSLGVAASDFVQMLLVVTVTVITAVLALAQPAVGGLTGLIERVPAEHFAWGAIARPEFIALWFLALSLNTTFARNSLADEGAAKYMMTRNDRDARRMVLIPLIGSLLGPLIWFIPSMAAAITHPSLAGEFPLLRYANEAAFLVTARDVLPQGMLGLLICGIFAATLTTMDASVNQGTGIFVRSFYLPVIHPTCPERRLLIVSKVVAGCFGALIIFLAVVVNRYRSLGLFDLLNQLGVSLAIPLALPACLGLFYRRTPAWSAWSTVLIGFAASYTAKFLVTIDVLNAVPGLGGPHTPEEITVFSIIATVVLVVACGTTWFFFTSLFYDRSTPAYRADVDEFFLRLSTPLPPDHGQAVQENHAFPATVGKLSLAYGLFVALFVLIPNSLGGRLCYVAAGGSMCLIGGLLMRRYGRRSGDPAVPEKAGAKPGPNSA
jgi:SSS family solute:Na+ symporter